MLTTSYPTDDSHRPPAESTNPAQDPALDQYRQHLAAAQRDRDPTAELDALADLGRALAHHGDFAGAIEEWKA